MIAVFCYHPPLYICTWKLMLFLQGSYYTEECSLYWSSPVCTISSWNQFMIIKDKTNSFNCWKDSGFWTKKNAAGPFPYFLNFLLLRKFFLIFLYSSPISMHYAWLVMLLITALICSRAIFMVGVMKLAWYVGKIQSLAAWLCWICE